MNTCGDKVGTYAGYMRHRNNEEETCEPCKKAASKYHGVRLVGEDEADPDRAPLTRHEVDAA